MPPASAGVPLTGSETGEEPQEPEPPEAAGDGPWPFDLGIPGSTGGSPAPAFAERSVPVPGTEPPPDSLEDTRPRAISTITRLSQLEPVSPALSLLHYTCVLVPRLPQHYLTGELADRLSQWTAQTCLAFGWRLEGIAVRPEYLRWSVQVAPAVSPGNIVRILRQRTSGLIFSAFPQHQDLNPSGDFWASGYLIVSGPQPPSAQLLRDYILQTRRRQGVIK
jgi:REP element-mobilizing transposase RayT